jgi:hypothetical protein
MSLALVIQRVQTLFLDRGETWCTKDLVTQFISVNNEDMEARLSALGLEYDEQEVVLANVPAQTADLSNYQNVGGPLDSMMVPLTLEWRMVGQGDDAWRPIPRVDKVLDTSVPNNQVQGIASFSWKAGIVKLSKSSVAVDIRINAEFLPTVAQSDSDDYVKGMTNVLAYWSAELIAMVRGGGASKLAVYFQKRGEMVMQDVTSTLQQADQLVVRRLGGRRSRMSGPLWRPPMG